MQRIRSIKPQFFSSEDIITISPCARLLFIGLWCEADKVGLLPWHPMSLKVRYLPTDNTDIAQVCNELVTRGLVRLYQVDGKTYAHVTNFLKHQRPNNKEAESQLPAPPWFSNSSEQPRKPRTRSKKTKSETGADLDSDDDAPGKFSMGTDAANGKSGSSRMNNEENLDQDATQSRSARVTRIGNLDQGEGKGREGVGKGMEIEGEGEGDGASLGRTPSLPFPTEQEKRSKGGAKTTANLLVELWLQRFRRAGQRVASGDEDRFKSELVAKIESGRFPPNDIQAEFLREGRDASEPWSRTMQRLREDHPEESAMSRRFSRSETSRLQADESERQRYAETDRAADDANANAPAFAGGGV
jgi:hypothetical protein